MENINLSSAEKKGEISKTAIYKSCRTGDLKMLNSSIEDGFFLGEDLNHTDGEGRSYLMLFVRDFKVCQLLINKGIDISIKDVKGQTALHHAARQSEVETVKLLISQGATVNEVDKSGKTVLHHLIESLALKLTEGMYRHEFDLQLSDPWIYSKKQRKEKGLWEVKFFLTKYKIETHLIDDLDWRNTLDHAVEKSALELMKYLVHKGANVNIGDSLGKTALHYAVEMKYSETTNLLIGCSADINLNDFEGKTVLHVAAAQSELQLLKMLLDKGATVDARDKLYRTPLHYCVQSLWSNKKRECCEILISQGADVKATDENQKSVLHYAVDSSCYICISSLVQNGASLTFRDAESLDPTVYASVKNKMFCVEYLIQNFDDRIPVQSQIDAYELLASISFTENCNILVGKKYLTKAMYIRTEKGVLGKIRTLLNDIFTGENREPESFLEIRWMDHGRESKIIQAAFIQARILGPFTETVLNTLKMLFTDNGDDLMVHLNRRANLKFKKHLFETMFTLYGESDSRCLDALRQVAIAYSVMFPDQLTFAEFYHDIAMFLDQIISACSSHNTGCKKETFFDIIKVTSYVIYILFEMCDTVDEEKQVEEMVRRLIVAHSVLQKKGIIKKSLPLLIVLSVCGNAIAQHEYHSAGMLKFIKTLVKFGIRFETFSKKRDSVLHYLLIFVKYKINFFNFFDISDTVRLMIDNGAHADLRNKDGICALNLIHSMSLPLEVSSVRDRTLQCLAAEVIVKNNISYHGKVPKHMISFVKMHG